MAYRVAATSGKHYYEMMCYLNKQRLSVLNTNKKGQFVVVENPSKAVLKCVSDNNCYWRII